MTEQPAPKQNSSRPIWEIVIADMQARDHLGRQRYGTPLQAGNGRDMLQDAYEEALDLAVYLRGAIAERDLAVEPLSEQLKAAGDLLEARSRGMMLPIKILLSDYIHAYPHFSIEQIVELFARLASQGFRVMLIDDLMRK